MVCVYTEDVQLLLASTEHKYLVLLYYQSLTDTVNRMHIHLQFTPVHPVVSRMLALAVFGVPIIHHPLVKT